MLASHSLRVSLVPPPLPLSAPSVMMRYMRRLSIQLKRWVLFYSQLDSPRTSYAEIWISKVDKQNKHITKAPLISARSHQSSIPNRWRCARIASKNYGNTLIKRLNNLWSRQASRNRYLVAVAVAAFDLFACYLKTWNLISRNKSGKIYSWNVSIFSQTASVFNSRQ